MSTPVYSFTGMVPCDAHYECFYAKNAAFTKMYAPSKNSGDVITPEEEEEMLNAQAQYIWRPLDGTANNMRHTIWGSMSIPLRRISQVAYADGVSALAVRGASNPSPRVISNSICAQSTAIPDSRGLSNMCWLWGQFLDHEIDLTPSQGSSGETANIPTVAGPGEAYPGNVIPFSRSIFVTVGGVRQHPNQIGSYVDSTNVYGNNNQRGAALRRQDGTGKMRTSMSNNGQVILPFNVNGLPNDNGPNGGAPQDFFLAGDIRANENTFLTAMHTLFVREHNRQCDAIILEKPEWAGNDELIFQHARRRVMGIQQTITFSEFLPALLGPYAPSVEYPGYDIGVDATVATEFSTVGYRFGHSMLSSSLNIGPSGTVLLRDAFFNPSYVQTNGADGLLLGATLGAAQQVDGLIIDDVRNLLFGPPSGGMMHDLAALNIQRGRDHGIPDYNTLREAYGLPRAGSFAQLPTSASNQSKLQALYDSVDDIDPWVGAIIETHLPGASVGPLVREILVDQFERCRRGDRFWFERDEALTAAEKDDIRSTRLSDVITRNTQYNAFGNVFFV